MDKGVVLQRQLLGSNQLVNVRQHLSDMCIRVFHKNTFSKEKVDHTLTTPYRAYIDHTQKICFPRTSLKGPTT